jgi:hypothetical protein
MLCRRVTTPLALLLTLLWPCIQVAEPLDRQWRFTVLLDGKPVGHHHVDLTGHDGEVEYRSETRLNVKILFLTVFRYLHTDVESWRDDCLARIESSTDNDGKPEFVRGSRTDTSFVVATKQGSNQLAAPCVMTFAYWNPRILSATQLMNAQTGEYVPVRITALGPDPVLVKGSRIPAERYAIVGDQLNIELWYAAEGRWVALATTTEGGGRLQYVLQ